MRRVEAELDNIRAVLRWGSDATAQADADLALRIVIALTILESSRHLVHGSGGPTP